MALAAILVLGLALRLAHVHALERDVLFQHPAMDEQSYVAAAHALEHGLPDRHGVYWQPPGIVYALAAVFRVAGPDLAWPRYLEAVLSAALALLVFALGRRLWSVRVGLLAAAVVSLHGVLVFESAELLPPIWIAWFDLLALWLVLLAGARRSWPLALAAGLTLGVSALFTPTILVFVPIPLYWLWRHGQGRRALLAGVLALGVAVPIVPVTIRNYRAGGELVLVSSNGGVNFFLGNNPHTRETLALRPGRHWSELVDAAPERAGARTPGAKSRYFYAQGLAYWTGQPFAAAGGFLRKLVLYLGGSELPRDSDIYAARSQSLVLAALVWPRRFPDGLLIPLALVGVVASWRRRRELALLLGFVAMQALVVSAFFVTSRYRVPALPVLCLLAVVGADALWQRARAATLRGRALLAAGFVALLVVCNLPLPETRASYAAELDFYRGIARQQGEPARAVRDFQAAADADPRDPRYWFELGNTQAALGDDAGAVRAWSEAAALDPWDVRPRRRMAMVMNRHGDRDGAMAALQANIDARARDPRDYAPDYFNLGQLQAAAGRYPAALAALGESVRLDPEHWRRAAPVWLRAMAGPGAPASRELWLGLAALSDQAGDPGGAELARRQADTLPP